MRTTLNKVGCIRKDPFGRIVIDTCISDQEHLRNAEAEPGQDRARCRILIEEIFERYVGRSGQLEVEVNLFT